MNGKWLIARKIGPAPAVAWNGYTYAWQCTGEHAAIAHRSNRRRPKRSRSLRTCAATVLGNLPKLLL